jgi:hypothetical protein
MRRYRIERTGQTVHLNADFFQEDEGIASFYVRDENKDRMVAVFRGFLWIGEVDQEPPKTWSFWSYVLSLPAR